LGREVQGESLLRETEQELQQLRQALAGDARTLRPLYLLRFADRRHGWMLGANSLFGGGLAAAGIPLAWQQSTNLWGFTTAPLTDLMAEPEAMIIYIAPLPFPDMDALADAVVQKETSQQILQRLSNMTARCTTCHDMYRFGVGQ